MFFPCFGLLLHIMPCFRPQLFKGFLSQSFAAFVWQDLGYWQWRHALGCFRHLSVTVHQFSGIKTLPGCSLRLCAKAATHKLCTTSAGGKVVGLFLFPKRRSWSPPNCPHSHTVHVENMCGFVWKLWQSLKKWLDHHHDTSHHFSFCCYFMVWYIFYLKILGKKSSKAQTRWEKELEESVYRKK